MRLAISKLSDYVCVEIIKYLSSFYPQLAENVFRQIDDVAFREVVSIVVAGICGDPPHIVFIIIEEGKDTLI